MLTYVTGIRGAAALNTLSVLDSMCKSNDAWRLLGDPEADDLFTVRAAGLDPEPIAFTNGVRLEPAVVVGDCRVPDLVVVPGLDDDVEMSMSVNTGWIEPVRQWSRQGAVVASSCTGAFILAEAGLLDGKQATTHWVAGPALAAGYPAVTVTTDAVVVDEGDVITSGGATTAFNLVLYLISRFGTAKRANAATRLMLLDSGRDSQQPFALMASHRLHSDPVVHDAQSALQQGVVEPLSVAALAEHIGVSPRTMTRRFRAALGVTPQTYLEEVRIDAARRLLEDTTLPVDRIRGDVGFGDPTSFRRAFKRATGLTPVAYRQRFSAPRPLAR